MSGPTVAAMSDVPHDLVAAAVTALEPELVAFRRDLHAHPELSWAEHRTTAALRDRLVAAGLPAVVGPTGTGVICDVGSGGPIVAIRGDIDALRLPDTKDVAYRSTVDGVCHACGERGHFRAEHQFTEADPEVQAGKTQPGLRKILRSQAPLLVLVATPFNVIETADCPRPYPNFGQRQSRGGQACVIGSRG